MEKEYVEKVYEILTMVEEGVFGEEIWFEGPFASHSEAVKWLANRWGISNNKAKKILKRGKYGAFNYELFIRD